MSEDLEDIPERDRLPVMRDWIYRWDDDGVGVRIVFSLEWPDVMIRFRPLGRGVEIGGVVRPDGQVHSLTIEAEDRDHGITSAAAHSLSGIVSSLKEWNAVARDIAEQILSGVPEDRAAAHDDKTATDSLRALFYGTQRPAGTRKRGADYELMLRQVVDAYTAAVQAGDPTPRKTVASKFGYTPDYVGRLLKRARETRNGKPPLLQDVDE